MNLQAADGCLLIKSDVDKDLHVQAANVMQLPCEMKQFEGIRQATSGKCMPWE